MNKLQGGVTVSVSWNFFFLSLYWTFRRTCITYLAINFYHTYNFTEHRLYIFALEALMDSYIRNKEPSYQLIRQDDAKIMNLHRFGFTGSFVVVLSRYCIC